MIILGGMLANIGLWIVAGGVYIIWKAFHKD